MAKAVVLRAHGGPDALRVEEVQVGDPGPGEVRLRQTAIGVNFHDTYVRSGLYRTLPLPGTPGIEAVGTVLAVADDVVGFSPGDRACYVTPSYGAYAEERLIAATQLVWIPRGLDDRVVAGGLVKGLTAWMLIRQVKHLRAGETCLVHAAAGGVGRLLCQWASARGAYVIGAAGTPEKAAAARQAGCHDAIVHTEQSVAAEVMKLTGGRGVDVVYDAVGRDTFEVSLQCLALRGSLIAYGQSSGLPPPIALEALAEKSITLSRPILFHYISDSRVRRPMARRVLDALHDGTIQASVGATFPLELAAEAHRALEGRRTAGSIILIP